MPLPNVLQPILHSDIVSSLGEFGEFEDTSGGGMNSQSVAHYPAGAKTPVKVAGTFEYTDMTLGRAHNPLRDRPVMDWVERYLVGLDGPRALVVRYLNRQGVVINAETYTCHPVSYKLPDGEAGQNVLGKFTVTLTIEARVG